MRLDELKQRILALLEVSAWPQMVRLVERAVRDEPQSIWEHPAVACRAVGGSAEAALPGSAAIVCSLLSIHLVDDILDQDPSRRRPTGCWRAPRPTPRSGPRSTPGSRA